MLTINQAKGIMGFAVVAAIVTNAFHGGIDAQVCAGLIAAFISITLP